MMENEAVKVLKRLVLFGICTIGPCEDCERKQAKEEALSALEEIKGGRSRKAGAPGTVGEGPSGIHIWIYLYKRQ